MPGERFSILYVQPGDPVSDSARARHRVGALLGALLSEAALKGHAVNLAAHLARNLGVPLPGQGSHPSHWHQFMRECPLTDFLDATTVVYRYLFWHLSESVANWWRDALRQIFNEEHLGCEVDDAGGVHPRVDREFQRNAMSAIAGLQAERYRRIRELIDLSSTSLCTDPPNYKQAWRAILSAVEVLFGQMFQYGRLTTDEIDRRLKPVVERTYEDDPAAQKAAQRMLAGFKEWVEASQKYRHQPGMIDPPQPPADIAVLSISYGAAVLRWLAGLADAEQAESRTAA